MKSQPRIRVTERDLDLLDALSQYRYLTLDHVHELFFSSPGAAEARLRALRGHRLVQPVYMPVRPDDATKKTLYALTLRGAELLRPRHDGNRPPYLTTADRRRGLHLEHTLARKDVRLLFERLHRLFPAITILSWAQSPPEVRGSAVIKTPKGARRVPCVPDGVAVIRLGGECQVIAIEVDLGTVKRKTMAERYRAYWKLWRDGGLHARYGQAPYRVLTLTHSKARAESLRKLAALAPEGRQGSKLFWFGLMDDVRDHAPERFLSPVFTTASIRHPGPTTLFTNSLFSTKAPCQTPCEKSGSPSTDGEPRPARAAAASSMAPTPRSAIKPAATSTVIPEA
jgi:hypothetical protein